MPSAPKHRMLARAADGGQRRRPAPPPATRKATWDHPSGYDAVPAPSRGRGAVQHKAEQRGRRSARFPDLHIGATAEKLGVTKSHLGKVLAGTSRPSAQLTLRLAEALGKDCDYVLSLYNAPKERRPGKR